MNCLNCAHSVIKEHNRKEHRLCRRFPPVNLLIPVQTLQGDGLSIQASFPIINDEDFCGEFKLSPLN